MPVPGNMVNKLGCSKERKNIRKGRYVTSKQEPQPPFLRTRSSRQQQQPPNKIDCWLMSLTIRRNTKFNVLRMDGSFAIATLSKSDTNVMRVKAEFFEKSDHVLKFETFLRYQPHTNLITRFASFECKPEDLKQLVSRVNNPVSERKTYIIVYQNYESTVYQLLKDKLETFWEYKVMARGANRAFITPEFQQFLNKYVDCLLHLHENGFKHGAIEDSKRCVLLSKDNLQSFKMIPSGKADVKEEDDLRGLSVMMSNLSPDYTCLYEQHAREFLTNSKRSVKDTLKTLKKHPLLAPPSNLKKIVCNVYQIWGQNQNSRSFAEEFIQLYIVENNWIEHYAYWLDKIEEWIKRNEERAEQGECNKQKKRIKNMGACMRHRRTEYHNLSFVELVRYMNNKFKHAWERDGNNVHAFNIQKAEFTETLIEIFPEVPLILFEYLYRSKSHFSGPYHAGEKYPCEGYSVMQIDVRY